MVLQGPDGSLRRISTVSPGRQENENDRILAFLENINECIRTEAEELAEYTLLAVHQPVNLLRRDKDGNNLGYAKEEDLLNHFLETPRPIPVVGKAGVGKSHIIRWLDAKLRLRRVQRQEVAHCSYSQSASLREVLTSMLAGPKARSSTRRGKTSIRCRINALLARLLNGY